MAKLVNVSGKKGKGGKAPTPPPPPPAPPPPGRVLRSSNKAPEPDQAALAAEAAALAAAKKAEAEAKKAAAAARKKGPAAAAKAAAAKKASAAAKAAAAAKLAEAKKRKKKGKGKGKVPAPEPEQVPDDSDDGTGDDDDDDDDDGLDEGEDETPAPPKTKKKTTKKKPGVAGSQHETDDDDVFTARKKTVKQHKKAKKSVSWTTDEDDDDASEPARKVKRSKRFTAPRDSSDGEVEVTPMKPAVKRAGYHSPMSGHDDAAIKPKDRKVPKLDFSHFDENRLPGPEEDCIPLRARAILEDKLMEYLPLHYFADEMIAHERSSCVVRVSGPAPAVDVTLPRNEENMTVLEWTKWGQRFVDALRAYDYPDWIPAMFESHFRVISKVVGFEKAWPLYRAYDLKMRAKFVGKKAPNISKKHFETWESCLQGSAVTKLSMPVMTPAPMPPKPRASTSFSGTPGASTSAPREPMLKYDRCLVCGNKAHRFVKGKTEPMPCTPAWLVWHAGRRFYLGRDSAHPVCYAWNSLSGCGRDGCRFVEHGHRCALCGSAEHGACQCPAVPL